MEYDIIKDYLREPMRRSPWVRKLAYRLYELSFLRVRYVQRELKRLILHHPSRLQVLDAGFGFGPYLNFLLRSFPQIQVTGLEVKAEQIEDCKTYFHQLGFGSRVEFVHRDLLEYEETEKFDLAIAVDILEHIEDDVRAMRNICRALKKTGMLVIHTPGSSVDSRESVEKEFFVREHVRIGYTPQELWEKLIQAGFQKIKLRYTYGRYGMIAYWLMQGIPLRLINLQLLLSVLLPFYYLLTFPFAHRLMQADLARKLVQGKGLLVVAEK